MPAKRSKPANPVTEAEVALAVKQALTGFGDRPLDPDVARRGLAHAAHDLIQLKLRAVAEAAAKRR